MKNYLKICIILISFFGCAKTNIDYDIVRNNSKIQTKTLATLSPKNISLNKEYEAQLGDGDNEIIDLNGNRVFASKFILPQVDTPFSLNISSSSSVGFFAPRVFFLDDKSKIIRTVEAKNLQFDRGFYKGTIFINTEYSKINSIVVTQDTEESNAKHNIKYVEGGTVYIPIGAAMVPITFSSGDLNKTLKYSYGGMVKITLKAYKPVALSE